MRRAVRASRLDRRSVAMRWARFWARVRVRVGIIASRFTQPGGIGVHIGARVSALAGANEVLVSSTLRDFVIGSGLEFKERGAHALKGVPGEWRLLAVVSP